MTFPIHFQIHFWKQMNSTKEENRVLSTGYNYNVVMFVFESSNTKSILYTHVIFLFNQNKSYFGFLKSTINENVWSFFFFGIKYVYGMCSDIKIISSKPAQIFVRRKLHFFSTLRGIVAPRSSIQFFSDKELQTCS